METLSIYISRPKPVFIVEPVNLTEDASPMAEDLLIKKQMEKAQKETPAAAKKKLTLKGNIPPSTPPSTPTPPAPGTSYRNRCGC